MRTTSSKIEEPSATWMVSFADLLSLILTFFVLIFSMANPMQMTNIFKNQFNSVIQNESDITFSEIEMEVDTSNVSSEYLVNIFEMKIRQDNDLQNIGLDSINGKFYISLPVNALTNARLEKLADFLKPYENDKHIYASSIESSKAVVDKLQILGVTEGLGFYKKQGLQDRIDIVIYP